MAITAAMVKELRESTGAGMMDAKKALEETSGDMEAAVDWLRTKGLAKAAKKSGRVAAEGLVAVAVKDGKGVAVEVNSETDFVGKNEEFQSMVRKISEAALDVDSVEALADAKIDGTPISVALQSRIAVNSAEAVRRLALAGEGIAFTPRFVVQEDVAEGRLIRLLSHVTPTPLDIQALQLPQPFPVPRVNAYLDHLRDVLRPRLLADPSA